MIYIFIVSGLLFFTFLRFGHLSGWPGKISLQPSRHRAFATRFFGSGKTAPKRAQTAGSIPGAAVRHVIFQKNSKERFKFSASVFFSLTIFCTVC
jgi:hypothetical protein